MGQVVVNNISAHCRTYPHVRMWGAVKDRFEFIFIQKITVEFATF